MPKRKRGGDGPTDDITKLDISQNNLKIARVDTDELFVDGEQIVHNGGGGGGGTDPTKVPLDGSEPMTGTLVAPGIVVDQATIGDPGDVKNTLVVKVPATFQQQVTTDNVVNAVGIETKTLKIDGVPVTTPIADPTKLPLAGGTLTGNLTVLGNIGATTRTGGPFTIDGNSEIDGNLAVTTFLYAGEIDTAALGVGGDVKIGDTTISGAPGPAQTEIKLPAANGTMGQVLTLDDNDNQTSWQTPAIAPTDDPTKVPLAGGDMTGPLTAPVIEGAIMEAGDLFVDGQTTLAGMTADLIDVKDTFTSTLRVNQSHVAGSGGATVFKLPSTSGLNGQTLKIVDDFNQTGWVTDNKDFVARYVSAPPYVVPGSSFQFINLNTDYDNGYVYSDWADTDGLHFTGLMRTKANVPGQTSHFQIVARMNLYDGVTFLYQEQFVMASPLPYTGTDYQDVSWDMAWTTRGAPLPTGATCKMFIVVQNLNSSALEIDLSLFTGPQIRVERLKNLVTSNSNFSTANVPPA